MSDVARDYWSRDNSQQMLELGAAARRNQAPSNTRYSLDPRVTPENAGEPTTRANVSDGDGTAEVIRFALSVRAAQRSSYFVQLRFSRNSVRSAAPHASTSAVKALPTLVSCWRAG